MKKPKLNWKNRRRARSCLPTTPKNHSLVVDGHFKSHHETVESSEGRTGAETALPMLQSVYDAATKTRTMIQLPPGS